MDCAICIFRAELERQRRLHAMEVQSVEEARFVDAQCFYYKKVKFQTPIFIFHTSVQEVFWVRFILGDVRIHHTFLCTRIKRKKNEPKIKSNKNHSHYAAPIGDWKTENLVLIKYLPRFRLVTLLDFTGDLTKLATGRSKA